jgi:hypothetical protein
MTKRGQFWEPDSEAMPQLFFREIILAEQVEVPPGNCRAVSYCIEKCLAVIAFSYSLRLGQEIWPRPATAGFGIWHLGASAQTPDWGENAA